MNFISAMLGFFTGALLMYVVMTFAVVAPLADELEMIKDKIRRRWLGDVTKESEE